jgi:hypothetical protein
MTRIRSFPLCHHREEEKKEEEKYCLFDNQSVKWMNAHKRDESASGMIMD